MEDKCKVCTNRYACIDELEFVCKNDNYRHYSNDGKFKQLYTSEICITPIQNKSYKLNYDSIKTIEDVVNILKTLDITFYEPYVSKIPKEYLIEEK